MAKRVSGYGAKQKARDYGLHYRFAQPPYPLHSRLDMLLAVAAQIAGEPVYAGKGNWDHWSERDGGDWRNGGPEPFDWIVFGFKSEVHRLAFAARAPAIINGPAPSRDTIPRSNRRPVGFANSEAESVRQFEGQRREKKEALA